MTLGASRIGFWFLNDPVTVSWNTSQTGILDPNQCDGLQGGWSITNQGRTIRYTCQPDTNFCNGCNPNIQTGTATATLSVGSTPYYMSYNLSGDGEAQDTGYELMQLSINGGSYFNQTLISAQSAGGGLGCAVLPVVQNVVVPGPIVLATNTNYSFTLFFTTGDESFNKDCYYECTLSFSRA